MEPLFLRRCWCGALLITVTASGLVFHYHEPHDDVKQYRADPPSVSASANSTRFGGGGFGDGEYGLGPYGGVWAL